ncbi:hypothetical protein ACWDRR_41375 [Kitasatospora sp. NPDC003701]
MPPGPHTTDPEDAMGFHVRDLTITLTPSAPADPGPLGASALDADAELGYDYCSRSCGCTNCSVSCGLFSLGVDAADAVPGDVLSALQAELDAALAAAATEAARTTR